MKLLAISCVISFIGNFAYGEPATTELLKRTEDALSERSRNPVAIVEKRDDTLVKIEGFDLLQSHFRENWRHDLNSLDTVAPTDTAKAIFFKAAQILPAKEYSDFLLVSSDLAVRGKLSKQQFGWAVTPSTKHLRGMWQAAPSQTLRDVAEQARIVFAGEPQMAFFDGVLSGKAVADAKQFREHYYGPSPAPRPARRSSRESNQPDTESIEPAPRKWAMPLVWITMGVAGAAILGRVLFRFRSTRKRPAR